MANVLEKDIEQKLVDMVRRHGGKCPKWVSPGWAGVPDRLCLLPGGQIIFVETKRPKGSKVSALQKKWRQWLQELGFLVRHTYTEADVLALEQFILEYFQRWEQIVLWAGRRNGKTQSILRDSPNIAFQQVWAASMREVQRDG